MEDHPTSPAANGPVTKPARVPWNKGKRVGAKPPLRPSHVWSIRTKLQIEGKKRDLALFNLAIDSKLRGCDVVAVRVDDVAPSGYAMDRVTIRQKKTGRPVRFELTDQTRQAIDDYLRLTERKAGQSRLVSLHGDAISVAEFYEAVYNVTPARSDDVHEAINRRPICDVSRRHTSHHSRVRYAQS